MGELPESKDEFALGPDPWEDNGPDAARVQYTTGAAWRRFFARTIDFQLLGLFAQLGLTFAYPLIQIRAPNMGIYFSPNFTCVSLLIALSLEVFVMAFLGNTPGKAVLGIRVRNRDGAPPTFAELTDRAIQLWLQGFGLGICLFTLCTYFWQFDRLAKGKCASYDEPRGFQVQLRPLTTARVLGAVGLFVLIPIVFAMTDVLPGALPGPLVNWTNPVTKRTTQIDSRWQFTTTTQGEHTVYRFESHRGKAAVSLICTPIPGTDLVTCAALLQKELEKEFRLLDGGRMERRDGLRVWRIAGRSRSISNIRCEIQLAQVGSKLYHLETRTTVARELVVPSLEELETALWSTILSEEDRARNDSP